MFRKRFEFMIDEVLLDWLREQAKLRHCTVAQVLRDLVVDAMKEKKETR